MSTDEQVVHVDDVPVAEGASGELRSRRQRLGTAAGCERIGVSRWQIAAGMRATPAHVHADEEEIFFVLAGSGLSWQDGRTFHVGPGDVIVHRVGAEAHTLLAGDDGLDVLAFAEGSDTSITYLPRTQMFWLGTRWLPADGPNPFKVEASAGPIERPEPEVERPGNILHVDAATWIEEDEPGYRGRDCRVAREAGARRSGLRKAVLDPGQLSCPPHWHTAEEEAFYILEGAGTLWLDDARVPLRPGTFVARPAGTRMAHALEAGADGLTYLAYGQHRAEDVCYYPRSRKLNVSGVIFRVEPVDYYDGERRAD